MKKRIICLLLAAVMVFSFLPLTAFAAGQYEIINAAPEADKDVNGGYITVRRSADEKDEVEVSVFPNAGYRLKSLTYELTAPKTVADVLPEGFPTAESGSTEAPAGAWSSIDLMKCYLSSDSSALYFYNAAGDPDPLTSIRTDEIVSIDDDGNYVYSDKGSLTVTFTMTGENGAMNSVIYSDTEDATFNGTYQESACVAAGTMITLGNGDRKAVEDLEIGDVIRAFDHKEGKIVSSPVSFILKSVNAANAFTLLFEGGVSVTVVEEHGFFDKEENEYAFINARNVKDYVGHHFFDADNGRWLALEGFEILEGRVDAYAIATSKHLNHLSNGLLSVSDGTFVVMANLFAFDEDMKFDAEKMNADIETYGLTPLEKVLELDGFVKADYYDYDLQYVDIAIGKGLITWEWMEALSDYCVANGLVGIPKPPLFASFKLKSAPKLLLGAAETPMKPFVSDNVLAIDELPKLELGDAAKLEDGPVEISMNDLGKYVFTMPAGPVVVSATFEPAETKWGDWEPFESGIGRWTYAALFSPAPSVYHDVEIRYDKNDNNLRQIKVVNFGEIISASYESSDLIIDWNASADSFRISDQSTGAYLAPYGEYMMIEDLVSELNPALHYPEDNILLIPVIYHISLGYFGYGYEALEILPEGALLYDSEVTPFSAEFKDEDTEITYIEGAALVDAANSDNKLAAVYVSLEEGADKIPAGEYVIDKSGAPGTVLASSGIVNGSSLTYSFAGNRNAKGQITTPVWFLVSGKVTVSYEGKVMTMVVAGKNSFGVDVDLTIVKTIPDKFEITDKTTDANGSVVPDASPAAEGSTVTLSVIPKDGFKLKSGSLKAFYSDGTGEHTLELQQDPAEKSKFTFTMPSADVTVTAEFEEASETFKAVFDHETGILSFYFDKLTHIDASVTVFDELPTESANAEDWPFDGVRSDVTGVEIDKSVADYAGLESIAHMFEGMINASDITGAEYLDVSNVTNMHNAFASFGFAAVDLVKVPDVSLWDTGKVTDMSGMFDCYAYNSTRLADVPAVGNFKTDNVVDLSKMFNGYANSSETLAKVPEVGNWNTGKVKSASDLFLYYGATSEVLDFTLDLSAWDLSSAENLNNAFAFSGTNAANWKVSIPYQTGTIQNFPDKWYGKSDAVIAAPAADRRFTLLYPVFVDEGIVNGKVEISPEIAEAGSLIVLNVTPDEGYELKSLTAVYNDGTGEKECEITNVKGTAFVMPSYPVTVKAEFEKIFVHTHGEGDDAVSFKAWDKSDSLPTEAGNWVLTTDVTLSNRWEVNGEIKLCLNGFVIRQGAGGNVITLNSGSVLELFDCDGETEHYFKVEDNGLWTLLDEKADGCKTVTGGVITGADTQDGGAFFVNESSTLKIHGGNIVGNKASRNGGGILAVGAVIMDGGLVTGNAAGNAGGGAFFESSFTVGGTAVVTGNVSGTAKTPDNVTIVEGKTLLTIGKDGTAPLAGMLVGVNLIPAQGEHKMLAGKFTSNGSASDTEFFVSDCADYSVLYNESGYLELKAPHVHNLVKVEGQEPTKDSAGFADYYECKDADDACHAYFEDADGKTPIEDLDSWKSEGGNGYLPKIENTGDQFVLIAFIAILSLGAFTVVKSRKKI